MMNNPAVVTVKDVGKNFKVGDQNVEVLRGINTIIRKGDFFVIFGPSGSGKSTLLHTILGLEKPTRGSVMIMDKDCYSMGADEAADFRKTRIGMVYQQPQWIKSLTVIENVAFPLFLLGKLSAESLDKAIAMLKIVGMEDWRDYMPTELSSGQQQRISLARAMINDPIILVADEPTGNLDTQSGEELMQLLGDMNKKQGRTVVMVTHDLEYLKYATRVIRVVDGLVADEFNEKNKHKLVKIIAGNGKRGGKKIQELEMKGKMKQQHISVKNLESPVKK